jgi:catechol-2,3-dioxygenase
MAESTGYAHVAITVSDHAVSLPFYETVLQSAPVGEIVTDDFDRKIFPVGGGSILGVTQYRESSSGAFDPLVPGLDHIGFRVETAAEIVAIQERLAGEGIDSDLTDAPFGTALMVKDPDGTQIEFFSAEKR